MSLCIPIRASPPPSHPLSITTSTLANRVFTHMRKIYVFYDKICTGCSLKIVFFLKFFWFFWTLPVLLQRWCSTCHCVHSLTPRGNRERPESGIYLKVFEKTQYSMNTLYLQFYMCRIWLFIFLLNISFRFFSLELCIFEASSEEWESFKSQEAKNQG